MGVSVHTIPLGFDNVYVLKDKGVIMIDSGDPKKGNTFLNLVGDMPMNKFPLRLSPGMPIYAENVQLLIDSWQNLLGEGVKTVFPAHGDSFSADIMRQELTRLRT